MPEKFRSDPSWEELEILLSSQSKERVDEAITQVALAKQLALTGLSAAPDYLVSVRVGESKELPENVRRELNDFLAEGFRVVFDSSDLRARQKEPEEYPRLVFSASAPMDLLDQLLGSNSASEVVADLSRRNPALWRVASGESFAEVSTPTGFNFRLAVEPHNQRLQRTIDAAL